MYAERHRVSLTTAADGTATGYTPVVTGAVLAVVYTKDGTTPYAAGVDFTITLEDTGEEVWVESNVNASKTVRPLAAANLAGTGAASTLTELPIVAAASRVKIAIAQGGDTKVGQFDVVVGG